MSKRLTIGLLAVLAAGLFAMTAESQPPEGGGKEKGGRGGQRGGPGGPGGMRPFELGRVLPPFVKDQLNLTEDQEKQLADLEKDVKAKLTKILTADQQKQLQEMRPPRGGPGGPGGEGGPPGGGRGGRGGRDKGGDDNPPPPPPPPPPDEQE
jgi:Spy/CpxP family protein refolding chaperone